jgi:hypothetical protein
VAVLALAAGACGQTRTERANPTTAPEATSAAAPPTTATVEPPAFTGAGSDEVCAAAGEVDFFATFVGVRDGPGMAAAFERTLAVLDAMAEVAPAELRPDLATATAGFRRVQASLAEVGWDLRRVEPQMLHAPEMDRSFARLDQYVTEVCRGEVWEPPAPAQLDGDEASPATASPEG